MIPILDMRNEFELDPKLIYLNAGSHSIAPKSVRRAVTHFQDEFELNPTKGLFSAWEKLWKAQVLLGKFLHARPADLFLRANVTEAMNSLILGFPLPQKSEILSTNLEYGAVDNIAQFKAKTAGLSYRKLELPHTSSHYSGLNDEKLTEQIISQFSRETSMLVISHIMTGTGLKIPLGRLAKETRKRGIVLAVDGAHAPGSIPLRFSELEDVDLYGGNLHKWVMAAKGTGFGWVAPRHQSTIRPIFAGWTTFNTREPFSVFDKGGEFQAKMLFSSSRDFSSFYALAEIFDFWQRWGEEKIFAKIYHLQSRAENLINEELGWTCVSPPAALRGPLLTYKVPAPLTTEGYSLMMRLLKQFGLQIAMSPVVETPCLRISPHVWNDEDEISRAVEILKSL